MIPCLDFQHEFEYAFEPKLTWCPNDLGAGFSESLSKPVKMLQLSL